MKIFKVQGYARIFLYLSTLANASWSRNYTNITQTSIQLWMSLPHILSCNSKQPNSLGTILTSDDAPNYSFVYHDTLLHPLPLAAG